MPFDQNRLQNGQIGRFALSSIGDRGKAGQDPRQRIRQDSDAVALPWSERSAECVEKKIARQMQDASLTIHPDLDASLRQSCLQRRQ